MLGAGGPQGTGGQALGAQAPHREGPRAQLPLQSHPWLFPSHLEKDEAGAGPCPDGEPLALLSPGSFLF